MADRFSSCCLSSSSLSAHSWQRCISFFLPLTILVRWTVAGLSQDWQFTRTSLLEGGRRNQAWSSLILPPSPLRLLPARESDRGAWPPPRNPRGSRPV